MSPERQGRRLTIVVTALITCVVTLVGTAVVATVVSRQQPPTPRLEPPKTVTVTLYPVPGMNLKGSPPTEIPAGEFDHVMRLVTPDKYLEGGVNDLIHRLIAEVVITHEDGHNTWVLVRWTGKNPPAVSVDGRHYFYARPYDDVYDGGMQLVTLVRRLAEAKSP